MMRKIDEDTYLMALAYFCVACENQEKVQIAEKGMNDKLGLDWGSHLSDAIYNQDGSHDYQSMFVIALEREGIEVDRVQQRLTQE